MMQLNKYSTIYNINHTNCSNRHTTANITLQIKTSKPGMLTRPVRHEAEAEAKARCYEAEAKVKEKLTKIKKKILLTIITRKPS